MSNLGDVLRQVVCIPDNIPDDWSFHKLTKVCSPKQWRTVSSSEMTETGYPVFGANGFVGFYPEYNHADETIAITCRGNTCGTINRIPPKTYITGNSMALDNVQSNVISQNYLYYALKYRGVGDSISGSAQPQITGAGLRAIEFPAPPLPEQQKIAAILSSVDDVIEKTRAQIDKLKDLKTGMMQELLTKGIGSGGVPHTEFKDSPVGRIPASWSVARLDALAKVGSSKRIRESEYVTEGVPFFRSKEVIRRSKGLDIEKTLYISKQRFTEISEKFGAPKKGDILITAVGTIGVVYLVEDREFYFKDGNLLWLRNIRPTVSSQYLAKIMASEGFQAEIDRVTGGSSQAALTIEKLQELTIVVPPLDEQEGIVGILRSLDEKYQATHQKLLRLRDLKKALMQDLLTGKVRVKVDQKESAVA